MTIYTDNLAWRWYAEWQARGGNQPPVMNLCHFIRVLVIWAPIRWFFRCNQKHHRISMIPGWMKVVAASGFGILYATSAVFPVELLTVTALSVLLVAVIVGVVWIVQSISDSGLENFLRASIYEPLRLYRDYRAAKIGRFCPKINVVHRKVDNLIL